MPPSGGGCEAAAGFTDSNAYLRELTLKGMLPLAPLLSQRTICQVLLKHLAKLQVPPPPPPLPMYYRESLDRPPHPIEHTSFHSRRH